MTTALLRTDPVIEWYMTCKYKLKCIAVIALKAMEVSRIDEYVKAKENRINVNYRIQEVVIYRCPLYNYLSFVCLRFVKMQCYK
jgi:hypothetical protein